MDKSRTVSVFPVRDSGTESTRAPFRQNGRSEGPLRISSPKSYFVIHFTVNIAIIPVNCKLRLNFFEFSQRFKANFFVFFTLDSGRGTGPLNVHFSQQNSHTNSAEGVAAGKWTEERADAHLCGSALLFFSFRFFRELFSGRSGGRKGYPNSITAGKINLGRILFFRFSSVFIQIFCKKEEKRTFFSVFFHFFLFPLFTKSNLCCIIIYGKG